LLIRHAARRALLSSALLCCLPSLAHAQDTPSRGITLPDRSITAQDDAASVEVNPAGLGFMQGAELRYTFELGSRSAQATGDDGHALFAAVGFGGFGLGFGAQWLLHPALGGRLERYRKYTMASAFGLTDSLQLGLAANLFGSSNDERLDDMTSWDLGLQWRASSTLAFSLAARDLNGPFLTAGRSLPQRFSAGFLLRLFDGRLQLDQELDAVVNADPLTYRVRLAIEPVGGLRLFGRTGLTFLDAKLDSFDVVTGLELSLGGMGLASAVSLSSPDDKLRYSGQSHSFWISPGKQRSLLDLIPDDRWQIVEMNGALAELSGGGLLGGSGGSSYLELLFDLDAMADDPDVTGVLLNITGSSLGYAQLWEVRQQIAALRGAGKKVVALVQDSDLKSVYLASAADRLWITPSSTFDPLGLAIELLSYKGALQKLGVQAEFLRVRDYKTAPESFVNDAPSAQSLEQTNAYLDALLKQITEGIAAGRKKQPAQVLTLLDSTPLLPLQAQEQGWADAILYPDEVEARLREEFEVYGTPATRYERRATTAEYRWQDPPEIAVVVISGTIISGSSGSSPLEGGLLAGSETMRTVLDSLRRDPNVKAVVLRVDSPGGSALASDLIFRELRRVAEKKPVLASMGNVAASGGYYVAVGADEIWATPNTLTGSIGIFAGKFSLEQLGDMLGVQATMLSRGKLASGMSIWRPFTPEQREALSRGLVYLYKLFLQQAASTRPLTEDEIDKVAQGHIWSGTAALGHKLVDHEGSIIDTIARAEELAGLAPRQARYVVYPQRSGLLSALSGAQASATPLGKLAALLGEPLGADAATKNPHSALTRWLGGVERALLIPMLFADGEALMLPDQAIMVR
jgi:protease IV